jgi:hypothetical protein
VSLGAWVVGTLVSLLVPLDATSSPAPVHPPASSGFAYTTLFGGFFGVGLIVLLWVLLHLKPKRPPEPYMGPHD